MHYWVRVRKLVPKRGINDESLGGENQKLLAFKFSVGYSHFDEQSGLELGRAGKETQQ